MKAFFYTVSVLLTIILVSCQPSEPTQGVSVNDGKNKVVETIMNRRSIRSYKSEQIKDTELEVIMECAVNAPSALNKQAWEVRVIQNEALINTINSGFVNYAKDLQMAGSAARSQEPGFSVFHGAPTVILVATNDGGAVDCGLLGENILLAAESMNIGTCVVGGVIGYLRTPEAADILSKLNLPEGFKPLYTISLGYKNERPAAKPRDKSKVQYIR